MLVELGVSDGLEDHVAHLHIEALNGEACSSCSWEVGSSIGGVVRQLGRATGEDSVRMGDINHEHVLSVLRSSCIFRCGVHAGANTQSIGSLVGLAQEHVDLHGHLQVSDFEVLVGTKLYISKR